MLIKVRIFPTVGDELILQNFCDKYNVKFEIGGPPTFVKELLGFERKPIEQYARTDWFVAYLTGKLSNIICVRIDFREEIGEKLLTPTIREEKLDLIKMMPGHG